MANHSYNTRNSNKDERLNSKESENIVSPLRSSFDQNFKELRSEVNDLKDVIIKDLIEENKKLRESNNKLKVFTLLICNLAQCDTRLHELETRT